MQPFDYTIQSQTPGDAMMQGLQQGLTLNSVMQQRQAQAEAQKAAEYQRQRLREVMSNPNAGAADYSRLMGEFPQLSKELKSSFDVFETGQKQAISKAVTPAYAALESGQPDIAIQQLERSKVAADNSGNTQLSQSITTAIDSIKRDPSQAKAALYFLGSGADDKFAENVSKWGTENRAAKKFPLELRQGEATALKTEAEAKTAGFETVVKAEEARIAPRKANLTIDKLAEEVGLTKQQAAAAKASAVASYASASNSTASAAKTRVETEKLKREGDSLPPEKRFELETKLRKEYTDNTKEFQMISEGYGRMKTALKTGAGDIAMVYAFAKMNDPTSVVREGEFATVQNSSGMPEKVRALYNKVVNGDKLSEGQRKALMAQGGQLHDVAMRRDTTVRATLEPIARGFKLDPKNIFYGSPESSALQDAKASTPDKVFQDADAILKGR
jgi:hypothetical protein